MRNENKRLNAENAGNAEFFENASSGKSDASKLIAVASEKTRNFSFRSILTGCGVLAAVIFAIAFNFGSAGNHSAENAPAEGARTEIENALFTDEEFFGSRAIVPRPTAEARENLARLLEKTPDDPQILGKLAVLDENLLRFDEAEKHLVKLAATDAEKLENLAEFYRRRARFGDEAQTLRKILSAAAPEKRAAAFERLIDTARRHDLQEYLRPAFYALVARENPNLFAVFARLIENLAAEKNYAEALDFTRQAKIQFPERRAALLEKEIEFLSALKRDAEAEKVYAAAFDPFWSAADAQKFYDFLNQRDRLRAYGSEIRGRFRRDPSDFDAAVRLALYQNHDYFYDNDSIAPTIRRLEAAKKNWTSDELIVVSRLLLQSGEGDAASRFLYTLYAREDFRGNPEQRARLLYQLFAMFCDARFEPLPLAKGDLRFYEDVARSDTKPGIMTGIISLIFSDSGAREKLIQQEEKASLLFNRAAAHRIFEEYKRENPDSKSVVLARMQLDLVELYLKADEPDTAAALLGKFAANFENAAEFPDAAVKLAEAYRTAKQEEKARAVYQKILDQLGRNSSSLAPVKTDESGFSDKSDDENENGADYTYENSAPTTSNGTGGVFNYQRNDPIENRSIYRDALGEKEISVTYSQILDKLVASFAAEKKTVEILELYSNEINKYPHEEWLYEQRLTWLEATNLTDEKLRIYKAALDRFQTKDWRDRLARFFLRSDRQKDFAEFSVDLINRLNEPDAESYLAEFFGGAVSPLAFEKRLNLKLYMAANARFPHNRAFVDGLLRFYKANKQESDWRATAARYYFEDAEVRRAFLDDLARKNSLRSFLSEAQTRENIVYELFRADASARLSDYEAAVAAYRKLNEMYPNNQEFSTRLITFTRSFGQKNRALLSESAQNAKLEADFRPDSAEMRTRGGEIFAELGDYEKARAEWQQIPATARGERQTYLDTAAVFWDYYQYADARRAIGNLRAKFDDDTLYAFETGAILESQNRETDAILEYVKALDVGRDETQKEKAIKRLVFLSNRRQTAELIQNDAEKNLKTAIDKAFEKERGRRGSSNSASFLSLGYAEFLVHAKEKEKASSVLTQAVGRSIDAEFLEAARDFARRSKDPAGERIALAKLAETEKTPRRSIAYRLQLADLAVEHGQRDEARTGVEKLVRSFPTNFGVIVEASDFYKRYGFEHESAAVLENAIPRSRGAYRSALAAKLAKRLIALNRLDAAERILVSLHAENKTDTAVFEELVRVCVRMNKPDLMRRAFAETVAELKKSDDADPREIDAQIATLRVRMIDAFTELKDYGAAVEQHIEIINREPENEESTENAVLFVERYGGAGELVAYYEKTASESFKNYRWNLVLARIYAAKKDYDRALVNYRAAIDNQPEKSELYVAVAEIEAARNNFDEALRNIDEALKSSGDDAGIVKKKIEILKKAGRFDQIEAEKAKLPIETKPPANVSQFSEAETLSAQNESEKARALYREAFARLSENPLADELKAGDLNAYARVMRAEESLDQTSEKFWTLREKLLKIADENDATEAAEARRRASVVNAALTETIGALAKISGTDDERQNIRAALKLKIDETNFGGDAHQSSALIQDFCRRAGFGDLEEAILSKKIEKSVSLLDREAALQTLVDFYYARGAYQKASDALETHESSDLGLRADAARLAGDAEKELAVLRRIYDRSAAETSIFGEKPAEIARYLEILHRERRDELTALASRSSVYQMQLINFLLARGERELAHRAIENSTFSDAWKVARSAETSLALREFDDSSECYFCEALQLDVIGEMIQQTPDKRKFLVNDDWVRLSREYGEWLFEKQDRVTPPAKFLTAMLENRPQSDDEQYKLGRFYLAKNEPKAAIEHLRLAIGDASPHDSELAAKLAALGAAYFKAGRADYAEDVWTRALESENIESANVFFRILGENGLAAEARPKLAPLAVKFLETADADDSEEFQNLIRAVAASFTVEDEKSNYFFAILRQRPTDVSLAAMLVNENLVAKNFQKPFYEMIIARQKDYLDTDYDFKAITERVWNRRDAQEIYEQENKYEIAEPETDGYVWRRKYLEFLLNERDDAAAEKLAGEIEKYLGNRYALPFWLRAARIDLDIRRGNFDSARAETLVGIRVGDAAANINAPNIERLNVIVEILRRENREPEAAALSESFFARNLALGQYEPANFSGLARAFFQKGETDKALRLLDLFCAASGGGTERENALAKIAAFNEIEQRRADAAKTAAANENFAAPAETLKIAAEIAHEFAQIDRAIVYRRKLTETNPKDRTNKIELAKMLVERTETIAAEALLNEIAADKGAARAERWQARILLKTEIAGDDRDAFAQFYSGVKSFNEGFYEHAAAHQIAALIYEADVFLPTRRELTKIYIAQDKPFAALRLAAKDEAAKPDELLEMLSQAAEKIGDFALAITYESAKTNPDETRLGALKKLAGEKTLSVTDFRVDAENTRKL